jgi:hypothetical protein
MSAPLDTLSKLTTEHPILSALFSSAGVLVASKSSKPLLKFVKSVIRQLADIGDCYYKCRTRLANSRSRYLKATGKGSSR